MPAQMQDVYSSHVTQIGHDPDTNELHVVWDTGKRSIYSGVPADKAAEIANSWSVGTALKEMKAGGYEHRYG